MGTSCPRLINKNEGLRDLCPPRPCCRCPRSGLPCLPCWTRSRCQPRCCRPCGSPCCPCCPRRSPSPRRSHCPPCPRCPRCPCCPRRPCLPRPCCQGGEGAPRALHLHLRCCR